MRALSAVRAAVVPSDGGLNHERTVPLPPREFFFRPAVLINGERVRVRRVSGGYACKYATDLCAVRVEVCRFFELNAPFWLPVALLFMVLGCFGIFAPSYDKKCFAPDLCFEVTVLGKARSRSRSARRWKGARGGICLFFPVLRAFRRLVYGSAGEKARKSAAHRPRRHDRCRARRRGADRGAAPALNFINFLRGQARVACLFRVRGAFPLSAFG